VIRIRSIRAFLLVSLLLAAGLGSFAIALLTYHQSAHEVEELFDAELAQLARTLAALLEPEALVDRGAELSQALSAAGGEGGAGHPYETKLSFRVHRADGLLLFASPGAPGDDLRAPASGFSWLGREDYRWRVFTLEDPDDALWIQVMQREAIRLELTREIAADLFAESLLDLVLFALIVPAIVLVAFRPVQRIAADLAGRAPGNLRPVDASRVPEEVGGLVQSLNGLFERLSQAFENERRFTADAAHELRTPLAGLLVHAENAQRAATAEARDASMARLREAARRLQRLVDQLLTLSRLDPEAGLGDWQTVELGRVLKDELQQVEGRAAAGGLRVELREETGARIGGNATLLGVLVRNLLDNALRHARHRTRVVLRRRAGHPELVIEDDGPGVPEDQRERILQRFYRAPGQASGGAGLGLSIVLRIAELHGASVALADAQPGLRVTVSFAQREDTLVSA
jgi:two-component system sensor histidine kinase QseC